MTPEAQRIAIAEACGWLPDHINRYAMYYVPDEDCHVGDPLSDLNACHEFEKYIKAKPNRRDGVVYAYVYENQVSELTGGESIYATAAQRCEAFLETIGKWTND